MVPIEIMDAKVQLIQVETKDETVPEQKSVDVEVSEKVAEKVVEASSKVDNMEENLKSEDIVSESTSVVHTSTSVQNVELNHSVKTDSKIEEVNHIEQTVVTRRVTRSMAKAENITPLQQEEEPLPEPSTVPVCSEPSLLVSILSYCFNFLEALIMMVAGPAFVYGLHFACKSSKHCTFLAYPKISSASWFFHYKATGYVFGWFGLQLLLSLLPLGKVIYYS